MGFCFSLFILRDWNDDYARGINECIRGRLGYRIWREEEEVVNHYVQDNDEEEGGQVEADCRGKSRKENDDQGGDKENCQEKEKGQSLVVAPQSPGLL